MSRGEEVEGARPGTQKSPSQPLAILTPLAHQTTTG